MFLSMSSFEILLIFSLYTQSEGLSFSASCLAYFCYSYHIKCFQHAYTLPEYIHIHKTFIYSLTHLLILTIPNQWNPCRPIILHTPHWLYYPSDISHLLLPRAVSSFVPHLWPLYTKRQTHCCNYGAPGQATCSSGVRRPSHVHP